ncbi:hypothetical protein [Zooshikella ganghwensis]|uniref:Response regulator receiver protein n=1 Tax=Zooshikella ganghwensis TaxID=202772 RepID=A0A4P9VRP0_9GAMM|nr:hypothetical protein [Zooshikella ganghwensis]RDH45459.1 hypothetical protein B9G39_19510 [Zooshikella ganghwensis]
MQLEYKVAVFDESPATAWVGRVERFFHVLKLNSVDEMQHAASSESVKLIVIFPIESMTTALSMCQHLYENGLTEGTSIVLVAYEKDLEFRMHAYEMGCNDVIHVAMGDNELHARLTKEIYHTIANQQLKKRLKLSLRQQLTSIDNLPQGVSYDFVQDCFSSENLDQLGQCLLTQLESFDIAASVQLRAQFGKKTMEAHGMTKAFETHLLDKLCKQGAWHVFGRRCVFNTERVSLLLKKAPDFSGKEVEAFRQWLSVHVAIVEQKIQQLDMSMALQAERAFINIFIARVQRFIKKVEDGYQASLREVADLFDNLSLQLGDVVHGKSYPASSETIDQVWAETNKQLQSVFQQSIYIENEFERLVYKLNAVINGQESESRASLLKDIIDNELESVNTI